MSTGTTLVLLGFGIGALILTSPRTRREDPRAPAPTADDQLRARAIEAQRASARASQRARELTAQWQERQEGRLRNSAQGQERGVEPLQGPAQEQTPQWQESAVGRLRDPYLCIRGYAS